MADRAVPDGATEDVVDLLLAQHARIEELFRLVINGADETRRDAFDELVRLLAVHETAEEEVVVHPLARTLPGGDGDAMVDERLKEERQAKELLRTLVTGGVDADGFEVGLIRLRDAVLRHARHEERQEFPLLRQHVPAERLRALAATVRAAEAAAPTRPHPSAQTAGANLAFGPVLAVADRVRDAVRRPSG